MKYFYVLPLSMFVLGVSITTTSAATISDVDPLSINGAACMNLTHDLTLASRDAATDGQVSDLQFFLQATGYLNFEPTGYFGQLTATAVSEYQEDNSIAPASGVVGPLTRSAMNAHSCGKTTNLFTSDDPDIRVTAPNGGEVYSKDDTIKIEYDAQNLTAPLYVYLKNSKNKTVAKAKFTGSNITTDGSDRLLMRLSKSWLSGAVKEGRYKIEICEEGNGKSGGVCDSSNNYFEIKKTTNIPAVTSAQAQGEDENVIRSGEEVMVKGRNFGICPSEEECDLSVYVGGKKGEVNGPSTDSNFTFIAPKLESGRFNLYVVNDATKEKSSSLSVSVLSSTQPYITAVSAPAEEDGVINSEKKFYITGRNLDKRMKLYLGGVQISIASGSTDSLTAEAPEMDVGSYYLYVVNSKGEKSNSVVVKVLHE